MGGLLIGSFLNVVSFRYVDGGRIFGWQIMGGRSKCRHCRQELHWYELIPLLSFIFQGAKCRHCDESLSWQYPTVETITGLVTAFLPIFFVSYGWLFVGLWLLASYTFIAISAIDFRLRIIPDQSNILLAIIGIALAVIKYLNPLKFPYQGSFLGSYAQVLAQNQSLVINLIIAAVVAFALFGGIIFFTKGRGMGLGDLKLAVPIALLLSWPDAIVAFVFAFIIGAVFGIVMMINKKATMKQAVPFGPFLALGVYVLIFYGQPILQWYFSLVS